MIVSEKYYEEVRKKSSVSIGERVNTGTITVPVFKFAVSGKVSLQSSPDENVSPEGTVIILRRTKGVKCFVTSSFFPPKEEEYSYTETSAVFITTAGDDGSFIFQNIPAGIFHYSSAGRVLHLCFKR